MSDLHTAYAWVYEWLPPLTEGRALADSGLLLTDSIIQLRSGRVRYIENGVSVCNSNNCHDRRSNFTVS